MTDANGAPLSKNALKKLQKAEYAAKKKAEKDAAKAAKGIVQGPGKKKKEVEEKDPTSEKNQIFSVFWDLTLVAIVCRVF